MLAKVRRTLHVLAATAFYYSGAFSIVQFFRRGSQGKGTYVLGIHRVLSEGERHLTGSSPGMILGETVFVKLLDYLQQRMQPISLETFLQTDSALAARERPLCLITFDDAWSDTATRAMPLLKARGMPAIIFVPPGVVGGRKGFWAEELTCAWRNPTLRVRLAPLTDRVAHAKRRECSLEDAVEWLMHMPAARRQSILGDVLPAASRDGPEAVDAIMTWEQLVQMHDHGIEVGAHTITHPLLTYEDDGAVELELRNSRQVLEEKLHEPVRAFAYPNGDWDQRVRERVIEAGYVCAFTTEARCCGAENDRFSIPRFLLHDGNVTGFGGKFSRAMLNMTLAGWA